MDDEPLAVELEGRADHEDEDQVNDEVHRHRTEERHVDDGVHLARDAAQGGHVHPVAQDEHPQAQGQQRHELAGPLEHARRAHHPDDDVAEDLVLQRPQGAVDADVEVGAPVAALGDHPGDVPAGADRGVPGALQVVHRPLRVVPVPVEGPVLPVPQQRDDHQGGDQQRAPQSGQDAQRAVPGVAPDGRPGTTGTDHEAGQHEEPDDRHLAEVGLLPALDPERVEVPPRDGVHVRDDHRGGEQQPQQTEAVGPARVQLGEGPAPAGQHGQPPAGSVAAGLGGTRRGEPARHRSDHAFLEVVPRRRPGAQARSGPSRILPTAADGHHVC